MSSTLYLINWAATDVTPTLNGKTLPSIKATNAKYEYYPYQIAVPRNASGHGQPGGWGNINTLILQPSGSGSSQVYNDLADPGAAEPNTVMFLWIFPEFVVFSQRDDQLGSPVFPGTTTPT